MKLCLIILSVPWYMFNGLEHTAILSHFLTFITGNCVRVGRVRVDMESVNRSRLLRIPFSADLTLYWFPVCCFLCVVSCVLFPVCCFWCKEFNPLVIWIWNQNIAISTIVLSINNQ
jgi:hypothetical protein